MNDWSDEVTPDSWVGKEASNDLPSRPSDPNYTPLKPNDLLQTLPPPIQYIVKKSIEAPLTGDEYERLGVFLESVMQRGENPFPIVRLFKLYLGRGISAVLDDAVTKTLDYYWHHWTLPARSPSPTIEDVIEQSHANADFVTEKLQRPENLPGVTVTTTGRYLAGKLTIRWMRTTAYVLCRRGNSNQIPDFLKKLRDIFEDDTVVKAFNQATMERIRRAELSFNEEFQTKKDIGVKDPMNIKDEPALQELKYLVKNFEPGMLPKPPTISGALTERSVDWIREKLLKFAKQRYNPDPFVSILLHHLGRNNLRLIFGKQFSTELKAEICDTQKPPLKGTSSSLDNVTEWINIGQTMPPIGRPPPPMMSPDGFPPRPPPGVRGPPPMPPPGMPAMPSPRGMMGSMGPSVGHMRPNQPIPRLTDMITRPNPMMAGPRPYNSFPRNSRPPRPMAPQRLAAAGPFASDDVPPWARKIGPPSDNTPPWKRGNFMGVGPSGPGPRHRPPMDLMGFLGSGPGSNRTGMKRPMNGHPGQGNFGGPPNKFMRY